jgi:hypothetical protein
MTTTRGEFIRKLGCLCIHIQRLNRSLNDNDFYAIEAESQIVQDVVLELIKTQRKLTKPDQLQLRSRFTDLRCEALQSLELSRHLLDESAEAATELIRTVQEVMSHDADDPDSFLMDDDL